MKRVDEAEKCPGLPPLAAVSASTSYPKLPSPASDLVTALPKHLKLQEVSDPHHHHHHGYLWEDACTFIPEIYLFSALLTLSIIPGALGSPMHLVIKHPRSAQNPDAFTLSSGVSLRREHGSDSWNQQYCGKGFSVLLRSFSCSCFG